jgi:chorismate mutase/prephenate dehydratase
MPFSREREKIDRIDRQLVTLLNRRASLAGKIGEIKKKKGLDVYDPSREEAILAMLERESPGPFPPDSLTAIFREIFAASRHLEEPLSIAYLGPQATFTHQACRRAFGASSRYVPKKSIREVFDAVEREECSKGVVPVENSTEGIVNHTLDMFLESSLKIYGEVILLVSHHLLSLSARMKDIHVLYSHPQALSQCQEWLGEHLPDVPLHEVSSTAEAARLAAKDPHGAAIASRLAGELYGLRAARRKIEDRHDNVTRFLVISREPKAPTGRGRDKTSIMFSIKDRVGALRDILLIFSRGKVNLTRIESRPSRKKAWDYVFFVDFEGHIDDPRIRKVVDLIRGECTLLKVLGSYPADRKTSGR